MADIGVNPNLTELLDRLGGQNRPIPFYAIYPSSGAPPITFDDFPLTSERLIGYLQQALDASDTESVSVRGATAMSAQR